MTKPLMREQITVKLYGGEDYRLYRGKELLATVYALDTVKWLLDRCEHHAKCFCCTPDCERDGCECRQRMKEPKDE
jgi:hypothetical protein